MAKTIRPSGMPARISTIGRVEVTAGATTFVTPQSGSRPARKSRTCNQWDV